MSNDLVKRNNPAGRLYHLFTTAQALAPQTQSIHGWGAVFGYGEDLPRILRGAAHMGDMVTDVRRRVTVLVDDDPDVVLMHFDEVEQTISHFFHMGNPMEWFLSTLRPTGMQCLRMCSSLLSRRTPEPVIREDHRSALVDDVERLISRVREGEELDPKTLAFVLDHLMTIYRALTDFRMVGTVAVQDALDRLVGAAMQHRKRWLRLLRARSPRTSPRFLPT